MRCEEVERDGRPVWSASGNRATLVIKVVSYSAQEHPESGRISGRESNRMKATVRDIK